MIQSLPMKLNMVLWSILGYAFFSGSFLSFPPGHEGVQRQRRPLGKHQILSPASGNTTMSYMSATASMQVVELRSDEVFMWKGHQKNLCRRIRQQQQQHASNPILLKLHWPCHELHQKNRHGNFVLGIYAMYVAAMAHENVFLEFQCQETNHSTNLYSNSTDSTVFSWLQHSATDQWGALQLNQAKQMYSLPAPARDLSCKGMGLVPLFYASELFRSDMRRMAQSIQQQQQQQQMLTKSSEWDQVAIHFRCGDILSGFSPHVNDNYGMVAFRTYRDAIESSLTHQGKNVNSISTIGIVTAPFDKEFLRSQDARHASQCARIVLSLQDYLAQHFPKSTVSIRNSPKESIPEVFSRLILADYSICIRSTFCLIPTLSTLGRGILLDGGVTRTFEPISKVHSNIEWLDSANTPYLLSHQIREMGVERTIEWLRND